jgi:protein-S-isoprenylcysteine O-methyltransferase Ste14
MDGPGADGSGELLTEEQWRQRWRERRRERHRRRFPALGLLFLVAGFAWLGDSLHWWDVPEGIVVPLALIFVGALWLGRWGSRMM